MNITPEQLKKYTPYMIAGVIAGVVGLLMKNKSSSTTTDSTASNVSTDTNGTASQISSLNSSIASSMQNQTDYFNGVITKISDQLTAETNTVAGLTSQLTKDESTITGLTTANNNIVNTIQSNSGAITSLATQVQNSATSLINDTSKKLKPTVYVKAGSVDQQGLILEYGDSINIDTSQNGFVGVGGNRGETNNLYEQQLQSQGVTPKVNLTEQQLNNLKGTAGV